MAAETVYWNASRSIVIDRIRFLIVFKLLGLISISSLSIKYDRLLICCRSSMSLIVPYDKNTSKPLPASLLLWIFFIHAGSACIALHALYKGWYTLSPSFPILICVKASSTYFSAIDFSWLAEAGEFVLADSFLYSKSTPRSYMCSTHLQTLLFL